MNNISKVSDWVIKIILVAIIIVLLIQNCQSSRSNLGGNEITGNVDIIEITCDKEDICKKPSGKTDDEGKLIVEDKYITWDGITETRIFEKTMYVKEGTIAPESSNTYQFIVKNGTIYRLKYNIYFIEDNTYGINMKYKLKKNDTYLIDHYVSASEINLADMLINADENDTFYLEWKWVSSSNDTKIGKKTDAKYGLKIEVKAESTND